MTSGAKKCVCVWGGGGVQIAFFWEALREVRDVINKLSYNILYSFFAYFTWISLNRGVYTPPWYLGPVAKVKLNQNELGDKFSQWN